MLCLRPSSLAQDDMPLVPLTPPINPALINIAGTWNYTASGSSVTGMCPPGPPGFGHRHHLRRCGRVYGGLYLRQGMQPGLDVYLYGYSCRK